jgi:hypothetical protein
MSAASQRCKFFCAFRKLRKKSQSQRNCKHFLREFAIAAQSQMTLRLAIAISFYKKFSSLLLPHPS